MCIRDSYLFIKYPVLGIGLGNYSIFLYKVLNVFTTFPYTVNNIYFETLCENGLIGFSILMIFLFKLFVYHIKILRKLENLKEKVIVVGLLSSLTAILFMFNAFPSHSLSFWWVTFGICIGYLWRLDEKYN